MNKWGTSTYRYFVLGSSAEINTEKNKVNHFYTSRGQHLVLNRFKASKPTSCSMSQVTAEIQSWMCMQDFFCSFCVKGEWTCYQVKPAKTWFDLMAASSCFSTRIPCKSHSCGELFHLYIFLHIMCKCSGTRN